MRHLLIGGEANDAPRHVPADAPIILLEAYNLRQWKHCLPTSLTEYPLIELHFIQLLSTTYYLGSDNYSVLVRPSTVNVSPPASYAG